MFAQGAICVLRFYQFFWDTLCKGWFGCKDFSRQGSVYWEGGGSSPPPKKKKKKLFQILIFFDDDIKESVKVTNV